MVAWQLDDNGVIVNLIEVEDLDVFPNLVDAVIGGKIGDSIVDGVLTQKIETPVVPSSVTMRQARLALLNAGKLNEVSAAISALSSPAKEAAQIEWEFSSIVERSRPLVQMIGPALGFTEEQLDDLFILADKL